MKKLCEDMAMSMYREGRLDREIAEAIGYSRVSVTNWRKSRGLPPNRRRRPEKMLDAYKAAMPLERVQELARAEKDGRLVVLPFCVGSSLYEATGKGVREYETEQFSIGSEDLFIHALDKVIWYRGGRIFGLDQIGKTVFLTREEAEAALKKREEADNEAD